jgi:uncharacterized membrane protein YdbT with pleckstrin-like domain
MTNEKIFWSGEPALVVVLYWAIKKLTWFLIPIGIVLYLYIRYATEPDYGILFAYIGGIAGFYVISVVYSFFLRKTYKYSISNQTVNFEGGILNKQFKNVPYHKITDITKSQTIVQRMLGIYDIHVQTAGTSFVEISFLGVKDPYTPKNYIMQMVNRLSAQQK